MTTQPSLFDLPDAEPLPPDQAARDFAIDPANDVVLEASAGTGKTRVLVDRYVRLVEQGVDPTHILAITFTRKAAAEMRERVLTSLRQRAAQGAFTPERWRALSERIADVQISTIDAFCFSLLREFPLEADVDPGFEVADETEMARFANEAMDLTLRATRTLIVEDERVRLLFTRVKGPVLRDAIGALLDRRHVAMPAVRTFVRDHQGPATATAAAQAFLGRLRDVFAPSPARHAILDDGPHGAPEFQRLHADITALADMDAEPTRAAHFRRRLERYFLTQKGEPRLRLAKPFSAEHFVSRDARKRHEEALKILAPGVFAAMTALDADVNGLLARGLLRVLAVAVDRYERLLDEHALLDFAGMLARSVALLERQEEFARSRLKLQARFHHVLVDEFQDTSRLQWRLIELLVDAWGEGQGVADEPTSIFIVGDRKQSIYRFRHAEVTLLDAAARKISALRPGRTVRQAIAASFRAVPELLAFVNALGATLQGDPDLDERFSYLDHDRFPVPDVNPGARRDGAPVLGIIAEPSIEASAAAVAAEIERLVESGVVRDRQGAARAVRLDDIAILFRARTGHQYFETALESRGIRTYVYKGLGFFDAPEVQDLQALLRFLAQPDSDLRAAELLRSRLVRLSDAALTTLAPGLASALSGAEADPAPAGLDDLDRELLARARGAVQRWLDMADRVPVSELVDVILRETAYVYEMRGRRLAQARENVKKVRALVRRVESRGYATVGRLASLFETLRAGDESNAIVEAAGAVNLMTMHAAKGLEFPIVFLVNLHMPGRGRPAGVSVIERGPAGAPVVAFDTDDATRLEDRREAEELRRLLYVAVTRARDRLYFAAELDRKGSLRGAGRSLGGLLPAGIKQAFAAAAVDPGAAEVNWTVDSASFAFSVCRPPFAPKVEAAAAAPVVDGRPDLGVLEPGGRRITSVTEIASARGRRSTSTSDPLPALPAPLEFSLGDRAVGVVVHRLFQREVNPGAGTEMVENAARTLVDAEDLVDGADPDTVARQAAEVYIRLRSRADVAALLAGGRTYFEVPVSYVAPDRPGAVLRGVIDCLVVAPDGRATVVEFKTGVPRPEHQAQADLYARAVGALTGTDPAGVKILYA